MITREFTLEPAGPAAALLLTDAEVAALGAGRTPPVALTIGDQTVRVRVARMGGRNLIGLRKELRDQLGVGAGDTITATVAVDAAERTVDVPPELAEALAAAGLRARFDALSYTARKEHARAVAEAKAEATRERRLAKILDALR